LWPNLHWRSIQGFGEENSMGDAGNEPIYFWESAEIGDAAPPQVVEVTPASIAEYCRVARYENLVYTNQPAARQAGLPDIVAPPTMMLALAPAQLAEVAAAQGYVLTPLLESNAMAGSHAELTIWFQGSMVVPGDVVTSVTSVDNKFQNETGCFLTFRVTAHSQRGEPVVDYCQTYPWPGASDTQNLRRGSSDGP
jgi:acyl dehydratase